MSIKRLLAGSLASIFVCCVAVVLLARYSSVGQAAKTSLPARPGPLLASLRTVRTGQVKLRGIHMVSRSTGWGVARSEVLRTIDGGRQWHVLLRFAAVRWPFDFTLKTRGSRAASVLVHTAGARFVVLSTHDGGRQWRTSVVLRAHSSLSGPTFGGDIAFAKGRQGLVLRTERPVAGLVPHQLFRTADGGMRWTKIESSNSLPGRFTSLPACIDAVTFDARSSVWATGQYDSQMARTILYHSTNGGLSWTKVRLGRHPGFKLLSIATSPPIFHKARGILPVYLFKPRAYDLYVTRDHGRHWRPTTPVYLWTPAFGPSLTSFDGVHVWLAANHAIYASSDRGFHWRVVNRSPAFTATPQIQFLNRKRGYAVTAGPQPHILVTMNGGRSWHSVPTTQVPTHR